MDDTTFLWIAAILVGCSIAAFAIARARGLPDALTYAVAGLLTGPIGILLAVFVRGPEPEPLPAGSRDDAVASLSQLADLRARGVLTEQEYQTKKTGIVSRL
jgi:Kef-type K+ transport system membrane component KefB